MQKPPEQRSPTPHSLSATHRQKPFVAPSMHWHAPLPFEQVVLQTHDWFRLTATIG